MRAKALRWPASSQTAMHMLTPIPRALAAAASMALVAEAISMLRFPTLLMMAPFRPPLLRQPPGVHEEVPLQPRELLDLRLDLRGGRELALHDGARLPVLGDELRVAERGVERGLEVPLALGRDPLGHHGEPPGGPHDALHAQRLVEGGHARQIWRPLLARHRQPLDLARVQVAAVLREEGAGDV